eukprot:TRINITY_DN716_c0_g1_i1.p1 TRINITY_DN716_c0_g1~~TRINITY_DN716_c0_g1_i1.p1  ORF type:complete len:395 (+),score=51.12 TRINITY_DN716_c0_g1_i1:249-1433(+)
MRVASPEKLQTCVQNFLLGINVLPRWIDAAASSSDRPGRGHYEWGNWSDELRSLNMWTFGAPWRTIIADIRLERLVTSISELHKLKDQIVWEIVEQTYIQAERQRQSSVPEDTVKTRIRSVYSWQRRHDVKKNSLMWFLDFAFVLAAYSEFQARLLFTASPIPQWQPERLVPSLTPAEFGTQATHMELEMIQNNFLPFYARVPQLDDEHVLRARRFAQQFCQNVTPPQVVMDTDVRETRGMPREDKAVDFMTPWLQSMDTEQNEQRWQTLTHAVIDERRAVADFELFKGEVCRAIVSLLLLQLTQSPAVDSSYVYDMAAVTAVDQSEKELLVPSRLPGQKKKRPVSRRTLRGALEERIRRYESGYREGVQAGAIDPRFQHGGASSSGPSERGIG